MITTGAIQFNIAMAGMLDLWVAANGGTETPFSKNGIRYLYCYNPAQHRHAYINLDTDMEVEDPF